MAISVYSWWAFLCGVSVLNILAWLLSATTLKRRRDSLPVETYSMRRAQLILSAGYVFGCAFRSMLPVYDVPRLCLVDSWLSSVIVGRSVATIAELCFVAQWALMLREVSRATGSTVGRATSATMVPLIAIAETCSWYAVLTTANIGHVLEESLWGLSAALLVISLVEIWPRCPARWRPVLAGWCIAGVCYVFFMFLVDVPMYWSRWIADQAHGRHYMSIAQGLLDASGRWNVSHRLDDWRSEMAWMSMYFSVAVWLSIALIHAPMLERVRGRGLQR